MHRFTVQGLSQPRKVEERSTRDRCQSDKQTAVIQKLTIQFSRFWSLTHWDTGKISKDEKVGPRATRGTWDLMLRQRWVGGTAPLLQKGKTQSLVTSVWRLCGSKTSRMKHLITTKHGVNKGMRTVLCESCPQRKAASSKFCKRSVTSGNFLFLGAVSNQFKEPSPRMFS